MTSAVETEYVPAVREETSIVRVAGDVAVAFEEYQKLQAKLDAAMPDCMMDIAGRKFRKKNYWRAIATAFNLDVELVGLDRLEDGDDWGYVAMARATAPNGRRMDGDGACFASEKARNQDSIHNVRAHAATRAINRAISNLVGFGEVSARQRSAPAPAPRGGGESAFDDKLGFGKHKTKTWRQMSEGSVGGERYSYFEWLAGDIKKKLEEEPDGKYAAQDRVRLERVEKCLAIMDGREALEDAATDATQSEQGDCGDY
jgi:hypothetical protein